MKQRISDEWLMQEVSQGHCEHLETLVARYTIPLTRVVRRMIADRHRSEELIQETFLAVWKYRDQYQSPRRFRPWLFKIAANKCREAHRRSGPPLAIIIDALDDPSVEVQQLGPAEAAVAAEAAAIVIKAVAQLPDQQRAVLVMRFWNDRPFEEIAQALGCSTSTARSHLYHALATMRRRARQHKRIAAANGRLHEAGIEGCLILPGAGKSPRNAPDIERTRTAQDGRWRMPSESTLAQCYADEQADMSVLSTATR
jgi:RNA polymerase sigma factor (sigma-70 family)